MLRRFKLFFIGMLMGTVMVVWFFGDRLNLLTSWMPNDRVLLRLQQSQMSQTERAKCKMACFGIEKKHIDAIIQEGDINFKESKTQQNPLIYIVEHQQNDIGKYVLTFSASDSTSTIIDAFVENTDGQCLCED